MIDESVKITGWNKKCFPNQDDGTLNMPMSLPSAFCFVIQTKWYLKQYLESSLQDSLNEYTENGLEKQMFTNQLNCVWFRKKLEGNLIHFKWLVLQINAI
jgi:hypothetical protein